MATAGTKGQVTRELILRAAAVEFRARGYEAATLESIAGGLGITRQAILYHFASKEDLLDGVVTPYLVALSEVLDRFEKTNDGSTASRRHLIEAMVDAAIADSLAAGIVFRDVTSWKYACVGSRAADCSRRLQAGLVGGCTSLEARTLAASVIGAMARPIVEADLDKSDPNFRKAILNATFAIAAQIDFPASTPPSE